jgi:tetratricopeptide (TPR) repeat protein
MSARAKTMPTPRPTPTPAGGRRRAFTLIALLLPVALLAALEAALRLGGLGEPASFFLPSGERYVTNPRFGWRFFPVPLARTPLVLSFPARKPAGTYRVFVFGESAAMGIPDPAFGFSRMLEVLLEERVARVDVEMINTAMTAINSHVVREIARECARHDPDVFLIYMGNNEVVGPFGPGTIFTRGAPPLPLIRARLALQRTRIGHFVERASGLWRAPPAAFAQWRGMEMLTEQQIPADDPRLERTYASFRSNLESILDTAASAGIPALVATVATNLRDSPPFASLQGRDADAAGWQYQLGLAALESGRTGEASRHLARARDLDLLRFRADSRVNEIIRDVADMRAARDVTLIDAERIFADAAGGPPGDDLFWEHVHLNEAGNILLARAFSDRIVPLMTARVGATPIQPPAATSPSALSERVAERLALTDWDRHRMAAAMLQMMRRPPFTRQSGHEARLERRRREVAAALHRARGTIDAAEAAYRAAIARRPDDLALRTGLAAVLRERGMFGEAAAEWRAAVDRLPHVAEWRSQLAFALADAAAAAGPPDRAKLAEAERILREVAAEQPELAAAHVNLGTVLERAARADEAMAEYREALRLDPGHDVARLNLAALHAARGAAGDAEAERLYREALQLDPQAAEAHARLARLLERRGDADGAVQEYQRAVALDPDLTWAQNNLGHALEQRGDVEGAVRHYRAAAESDPEYTLARLNLADLLLRQGRAVEAVGVFEEVLALARARGDARLLAAMDAQIRRLRRAPSAR